MLSKSSARLFFLLGTGLTAFAFVLLTVDSIRSVPAQTHQDQLTPSAIRGKDLWDRNNCMGCHTILGEGAYYAPELTKVYERRGAAFVRAMLKDPESMYPGQRRMVKYNFNDEEITDLVAFLKWIGEMDLNGFPSKPSLVATALPTSGVAPRGDRPMVFNQMCTACHMLDGKGGSVGPVLNGVGRRLDRAYLTKWLQDPQAVKPGTTMPKLPLSPEDISELVAFLSQQTTDGSSQ